MLPHRRPFFDAWVAAATGPAGFWTGARPEDHFRTAATSGPELAAAVAALLAERPSLRRVVELGAGSGALLAGLAARVPGLELVGVDVRGRPAALPAAVGWRTDCWSVTEDRWLDGAARLLLDRPVPTLVLAVEWLDDLPCRLAERTDQGWVELDEDLVRGGPLAPEDRDWLGRWWPGGHRAEVGRTRDEAWAAAVRPLRAAGGAALLVDYGHTRDGRPARGTLAGYRRGRSVDPRPTADRNVTAHVALDAVEEAGTRAGARTVLRGRQADVLPGLLPRPAVAGDALAGLAARSRAVALTSPVGWGRHSWLLQEVTAGAVGA